MGGGGRGEREEEEGKDRGMGLLPSFLPSCRGDGGREGGRGGPPGEKEAAKLPKAAGGKKERGPFLQRVPPPSIFGKEGREEGKNVVKDFSYFAMLISVSLSLSLSQGGDVVLGGPSS